MSIPIEPHIAAAKVIAAGSAGDGWLRASVVLTPLYPAASAEALAHWPSQVIEWLRYRSFELALRIEPVRYTAASGGCATLPRGKHITVRAEVAALGRVWKGQHDTSWVDALWADAFQAQSYPAVWSRLGRMIERSTTREALSASENGMPNDKKEEGAVRRADSQSGVALNNGDAVVLDYILPSRQTDLALLLEYKRALEMCGSVAQALESRGLSEEVNCSLESQKKASEPLELAVLVEDAKKQYKNALNNAKALYAEEPCGPGRIRRSIAAHPGFLGAADSDRLKFESQLRDPLDSYEAANQPQKPANSTRPPQGGDESLFQVFYSLQASPTLSRLFGLTLDVRFKISELLPLESEIVRLPDRGYFLYLALEDGTACQNPLGCTIHTFAKYRPSAVPHFWPASRTEVGLGKEPSANGLFDLAQFDGVMVAGRPLDTTSGHTVSRFELSCLDVHSACEASLDRRRNEETEEQLKQQLTVSSPGARPPAIARKTYVTAGLVILDRGRQDQAISQLAARTAHQNRLKSVAMVLDADDLTIGYRLDVGVPLRGAEPRYAWRGLMARDVKYGITGQTVPSKRLRAVAVNLFLEDENRHGRHDGWRACLEDGFVTLPARLLPRTKEKGGPVDAYVEEAIATWNGEPMAVPCAGTRDEKVKPSYGLPTGCVIRAPTSVYDSQRRIPPLRFGCPYRVGLRVVYSGGISMPLEAAVALYDHERERDFPLGGALTIPAASSFPTEKGFVAAPVRRRDLLRRFLRHERIDAPFLLMPEDVALRRNGVMGYERTAHAVVRTVLGSAHERERPRVTQRVFVPPGVSQSFAVMHGVCDKTVEQHPPQGLASKRFGRFGVRYDALDGGFPVATADHITGFNGVLFPTVRRLSTSNKDGTGELVYSTSPGGRREKPYYPDPAAKAYAIGIRVAGTSTYLGDQPCFISAYGPGWNYPDARPLVLTIQRSSSPKRQVARKLEDVLSCPKAGANGRVSGLPTGATRYPGTVEALVSLSPGDDFEVDVWCIPEAADLAKTFAITESVGALAMARAAKGSGGVLVRAQVCDALRTLLPEVVCDVADRCLPTTGVAGEELRDWSEGCGGPGGLPAPGPESLSAIARALHGTLVRRPLDEIAAVRTLRVTHATDRPVKAPQFLPSQAKDGSPSADSSIVVLSRQPLSPHEREAYTGTGDIALHLATTGCIEINAFVASPTSDRLDDIRRARALRDRRNHTWPEGEDRRPVPRRAIFGFDVSDAGDVTLLRTDVVLYRLDDIPLPTIVARARADDGMCRIPLSEVLELRDRKISLGTGKPTFQFADGLARKLLLRITAYARHSDQMRGASVPAQNGRWLRPGTLPEKDALCCKSVEVEAWLPAAVRPSEPAARTPVPAFLWTTHTVPQRRAGKVVTVTRRVVVRIPLARPWFSSGEDERLGIVLWPPDLFDQDKEKFQNDEVTTLPARGSGQKRVMDLKNFQDEDLGPGGKFITRWGGDPIRAASERNGGTFVPASAFVDRHEDVETGFKAELVHVAMPVRISDPGGQTGQGEAGDSPTLNVSLLTYQPKFDVDEEQWYVDVAMEHEREAEPFVRFGLVRYQPHAPKDLRVSYPVVQWTQLLPRRTVQVQKTDRNLSVRVEGLAPLKMSIESDINEEIAPVPQMTARVVRESTLDLGIRTQRVVAEEVLGAEKAKNVGDRTDVPDAYSVWYKEFILSPQKANDTRERAKYVVMIEEREARLPASYPSEPVSPKMALGRDCKGVALNNVLVESGPRFLAKVEI